jgi:uncharacterized protein YcfL
MKTWFLCSLALLLLGGCAARKPLVDMKCLAGRGYKVLN